MVIKKMSEVFICRCEEITREEIEEAIEDGAESMNEVKRCTRAGMGLCQGRTCRRQVEKILAEKTGKGLKDIMPSNYRQPVRPIKMEVIANSKKEGEI
jgi:NAD(P)H-nitrite reductase large subunit